MNRSADPFLATLQDQGWGLHRADVDADTLEELRRTVFSSGSAGKRCLLDQPLVHQVAVSLGSFLQSQSVLSSQAIAIQAIAFDKTENANWLVSWHQDVMFPFARAVSTPGFEVATVKEHIHYARPPEQVLEKLLAVRLHLDDCGPENGPLRVSPGTHRRGLLPGKRIREVVEESGDIECLAGEGEILLMKPLLLHTSSKAIRPGHRRVLHFVYYSGEALSEPWYRAVFLRA